MQATHCQQTTPVRPTVVEAEGHVHASKLRIRCRWLRRGAISRPDKKQDK